MKIAVLIVAAGSSSRLPGDRPKPYRLLRGQAVLRLSLHLFTNHPQVTAVQVVIDPDHELYYKEAVAGISILPPIPGGRERQESVCRGLEALASLSPDWVLIHDAARPNVSVALIDRVISALKDNLAAVPMIPMIDTIKRVRGGFITDTLPRTELMAAQTPQGFHFQPMLDAHRRFAGQSLTDDAAIAEAAGIPVAIVEGERTNFKLTTIEDWERMNLTEPRTGMGFDVHRLIKDEKRPLMICGIEISGEWALEGHSDADVGLHALVDAILGAIGAGDIGQHFPPSDARWKNADSCVFVTEGMRLLAEKGGRLVHADITLICEKPKISPHRGVMRTKVADLLQVDASRVSIKATTTEGLGFTGRGEGIAAQAVATVMLPG